MQSKAAGLYQAGPVAERRIAVHLRACGRVAVLVVVLVGATLDAVKLYLCGKLSRRPDGARWLHRWSGRILWSVGVTCTISGDVPEPAGFRAIVCNHLSYLDVLLLSSAMPCIMVAKSEVRRWPLIGWLTTRSGAVYVWRGGRPETYPRVNAAMAEAYRSGLPVAFFPEGTTTNGRQVLPFRRGLFHSVVRDCVEVRTAALRYELVGEQTQTTEQDVCWTGDAALVPHLYRLLGLRGVRAHLRFGRPAEGENRFQLSESAHQAVMELAGVAGPAFA